MSRQVLKMIGAVLFICQAFSFNSRADTKSFELLYTCWLSIDRTSYHLEYLTNDFAFIHVLRFTDLEGQSSDLVIGKDNFLALNRVGAALLIPTVERTSIPNLGSNGYNNYKITVFPPGEKKKVQVGYSTSLNDEKRDMADFYGAPGWSPEADALYAKYERDPVKYLNFERTLPIMKEMIKKRVAQNLAAADKTQANLSRWIQSAFHSTQNGFATHPLAEGQINKQRLDYEKVSVAKALQDSRSCEGLNDLEILKASIAQTNILRNKQKFLRQSRLLEIKTGPLETLI